MNSQQRFSDRVAAYRRYRPSYPTALIDLIVEQVSSPAPEAADIGSGTGILSRLLLDRGFIVHAVEPNRHMRLAAEEAMAAEPRFRSIEGEAERTTLADTLVDLVVCAQSFHWFATEAAATELRRVLRPDGLIVLVWNDRDSNRDEFHRQYEMLLTRYGTDYALISHRNVTPARIEELFHAKAEQYRFPNSQTLTWEGLRGRLESSSYTPKPPTEEYHALLREVRDLYDRNEQEGTVTLVYNTIAYLIR